ncbi:MAG TPA: protoporphyrinogen oxidase [Polyangiaceae bacterium]|nr:protoporphyrinogen oxidase [Polyangiaceae bacterium]
MSSHPWVIVGGGVSGLVLAHELSKAGRSFVLLEGSARLGGNVRTLERDGFLYDVGPDSFLRTKPEGVELCRELGLEDQLIEPSETGVWVARDGALFPMPEGLSLGVPTRVGALLETPLLSDLGKARAMLEPFVPPRKETGDESILHFLTRRVGAEMAERLAAPLLAGVYAGDARQLGIQAAFPQLVEFERKQGSLFRGFSRGRGPLSMLLQPPPAAARSTFVTLRRGLGQMIDALVARLPADSVRREARVEGLQLGAAGPELLVNGETLRASKVVVTGAPRYPARLLTRAAPELAALLGRVRGAATATVFFALRADAMERAPSGTGFIVPPGEGEILASTWVSSKWDGRAPAGGVLIRAFLGGALRVGGDVMAQTDEELISTARRELKRFLGGLGPELFTAVHRYEEGSPQPEVGYADHLRRVQDELSRHPWLAWTGPGLAGVGIPDCIREARACAQRLLADAPS